MPRMPSSSQHAAVHPDHVNINVVFSFYAFVSLLDAYSKDHKIQCHFEKVLLAIVEAKGKKLSIVGHGMIIKGFLIFAKKKDRFQEKKDREFAEIGKSFKKIPLKTTKAL
jgi:hypothetical protein